MSELNTIDKLAMYIGTGLVLLGTAVIGLVEMLIGSTHPVTGEGQIVHESLVPVDIRSYIIILGLVIWGLYAIYKVLSGTPPSGRETTTARDPTKAD
ncbi:MAG: hypothetical protein ACI9EZ_000078 [Halobacteriales archaeon]|jgi:hypothetical protein